MVLNTEISFCDDYIENPRPSYDDRTCYEIMNEPLAWDKPQIVIVDEHGSWAEVLPNGMYQVHWSTIEIHVNERSKGIVAPLEDFSSDESSEYSSSDEESKSDTDFSGKESSEDKIVSNQEITHLSNPNNILKDFDEKMSIYFNKPEFVAQSIAYVKKIMPTEIWPKTEQEVRDDNAAINAYLKEFVLNTTITKPEEAYCFVNFYSTVTTYTTINLFPDDIKNHPKLLQQVYDNSVKVTVEAYSLKGIYPG